jgi:hypothetical protein
MDITKHEFSDKGLKPHLWNTKEITFETPTESEQFIYPYLSRDDSIALAKFFNLTSADIE